MIAYWKRYCPAALARGVWATLARVHNGGPTGAARKSTLPYWNRVAPPLRVSNSTRAFPRSYVHTFPRSSVPVHAFIRSHVHTFTRSTKSPGRLAGLLCSSRLSVRLDASNPNYLPASFFGSAATRMF